jgi:hypothetical protein
VLFSKGKIPEQIIEPDDSSVLPEINQSSPNASTNFGYVSYIVCNGTLNRNFFEKYIGKKSEMFLYEFN